MRGRRTILPTPDPTSPITDKYGNKMTLNGYDWSERHMDPEYAAGLRGEYDSEPDYDDFDDRDYDDEE